MESSTAPKRAIDAATLAEAFRLTAEQRSSQVAVRTKDDEVSWTWGELRDRVDALAGGLAERGVGRGDTVALMLGNRPEFHLADLAAVMLGATPFSIYMQYTPEQIAYVVGDAGARVIVTEEAFLPRVLEARASLPALEHVIVVDGTAPEGVEALADVTASFDGDAAAAAIEPDDLLTLIYTSGTTGPPKGVELTHRNVLAALKTVPALVTFPQGTKVISWLPNAHIAERNAHHYLPILFGFEVTTCPDARQIIAYLPAVRPHWFFAVPRIWEKLKSGLEAMVAGQPDEQREPLQAALDAALEKVRLEQAGEPVPGELAERVAAADAAHFAPLRAMLGLDRVVTINVGAAPTPVEVLELFHAIGLPLAELWGMSETCGTGAVNPPARVRIGTVGPPNEGCEVRLAPDGELLVRSPFVMRSYRNRPDETAAAIDEDGWLHTGDIAEIDAEGYVRIVDRKKELIINAAGKNMSPANIESALKASSSLIGNAVCIGDARPYNTALVVLDSDFAPAWAAQQGIEERELEDLARDARIRAAVQAGVDAANAKLARVEQIKRFAIVEGDWLPGGDELTPTMKLKRRPIAEKYEGMIEGLYAG